MKKNLKLFTAGILSLTALAGCGQKAATAESKTIKIGLNYELSGDVATYGQGLAAGVKLALDEINKAGGVLGKQIEVVEVDNKSNTEEAANVSSKLATRDNVLVILGPATSGNVKAALPPAQENKVPLISASSTADDVTLDSNGKVREYVFKTCFSDSFQGVTMASFAVTDLGLKTAAVLMDNSSDYSKGVAKNFKSTFASLGGKVVAEEAYQAKDTDFKTLLTTIKASNPDFLFVPGYYNEVGLIIKQARELGINVPVLGADGFDSPKLLEIAGVEALNGTYYSNHYSSGDTTPEVVAFKTAFKAVNGSDPDAFNALGYDLGYFAVDAIKRAGAADREKVKDALASTVDFKGITGTLSIDEFHNPVKSVTILEVVNGVPTFLKKQAPAQ